MKYHKISNIKKGIYINYNQDIYKVISFLHVKIAKGSAFIRTKLKSLTNGKLVINNFTTKHKFKEVIVNSFFYQYLYRDKDLFCFMSLQDFSQLFLEEKFINKFFIIEGLNVLINFFLNEQGDLLPISVDIPKTIILKIKYTENTTKGNTINSTTKDAILETGLTLQVPMFVNIGDKIKINTQKKCYLERIK